MITFLVDLGTTFSYYIGMQTKQDIIKRAKANAAERLQLIKDVIALFEADPALANKADDFDSSFLRKIYHFPGDITSHRIANVLSKIS